MLLFCLACSYGYAAAPAGQGVVGATQDADAGSVYGKAAKRQKTAQDKKEAAARKQALQEEAQRQLAAGEAFTITNRAPWAEKQAVVRGPLELVALVELLQNNAWRMFW